MHEALLIREIFCLILDHIEDHRSLLSVALVCRAFSKPCMTLLWKDMWSLDPFMPLVPEGLKRHQNLNGLHIIYPPNLNDLRRFKELAVVVRTLTLNLKDAAAITGLGRIYKDGPSPPLFPRLQCLDIKTPLATLSWVVDLLSDTLRHFTYRQKHNHSADAATTQLRSFMDILPGICHNLNTLELHGPVFDFATVQGELVGVIERLQRLSTIGLYFNNVRHTTLDAISRIDRIDRLYLWSGRHSTQSPLPVTFETLKGIHLSPADDILGPGIFQYIDLPAVEEIHILFGHYMASTRHSILAFVRALSEARRSLRNLHFQLPWELLDPDLEEGALQRTDFTSLSECHALESVAILVDQQGIIQLLWDDADILLFGRSWQNLQHLELRTVQGWRKKKARVSLTGLLPLAQYCRALRTLVLAVDMSEFHWPSDLCPPAPALREFELEINTVLDANDEAQNFMAAIWPNVRLLKPPKSVKNVHRALEQFCDGFNSRHEDARAVRYA